MKRVLVFTILIVLNSSCNEEMSASQYRSYVYDSENGLNHNFLFSGKSYELTYLPVLLTGKNDDSKRYFKLKGPDLYYRFEEEDFSIRQEESDFRSTIIIPENDGLDNGHTLVIGFPEEVIQKDFTFLMGSPDSRKSVAEFSSDDIQFIEKIRLK